MYREVNFKIEMKKIKDFIFLLLLRILDGRIMQDPPFTRRMVLLFWGIVNFFAML